MAAYANEYGFTEEQKEDLIYLVREMDNDYLKRQAKKTPPKGNAGADKDTPDASPRT